MLRVQKIQTGPGTVQMQIVRCMQKTDREQENLAIKLNSHSNKANSLCCSMAGEPKLCLSDHFLSGVELMPTSLAKLCNLPLKHPCLPPGIFLRVL